MAIEEIVFIVLIACAAPLIWLSLFLLEDRKKPEPKGMIGAVFAGGVMAGIVLFGIYYYFVSTFLPENPNLPIAFKNFFNTDPNFIQPVGFILIKAFIEEILKFAVVYIIVSRSKFFDEPIDAMVYMITGAMGFAAMENIFFALSSTDPINLMIFRFFGAVLLHAFTASIIGFYWAKGRQWKGVIIATALHSGFNILVVYFENGILLAIWLLIIVAFFILRNFDIIKHNKWTTTKFKR